GDGKTQTINRLAIFMMLCLFHHPLDGAYLIPPHSTVVPTLMHNVNISLTVSM
ncbi:hypothetical protein KUCAC02_004693, partial [Chaenocephalus aceratus]